MATATEISHERVCGTSVAVLRRGTGPPVLLLHGLGIGFDAWTPLIDQLGDRSIVAIDPPGIGRSPATLTAWSIPRMAALCTGVLDTLEHDRVDVVGYSWGGLVAQQLAATDRERIGRVALVSTSCGVGAVPGTWAGWWSVGLRQWGACTRSTLGRLGLAPSSVRTTETVGPTAVGLAGQLCAASTWSSVGATRAIRQPVLVVTGDRDAVVPELNARWLAAALTDARLCRIAGAGHELPWTHAEELAERLISFLEPRD